MPTHGALTWQGNTLPVAMPVARLSWTERHSPCHRPEFVLEYSNYNMRNATMTKIKFALIVLFLFLFTLPALAQGKNIVRVKVPKEGKTFTVKLADNTQYVVDPFEAAMTPDAEIVNGDCITNYAVPTNEIGFNSHFKTSRGDGSGCTLELKVINRWDDANIMTFLKVRGFTTLNVTQEWQNKVISKGSYSIAQNEAHVTAELDLAGSSNGCSQAHDADVREQDRGYGIQHRASYYDDNNVLIEHDILENRGSWYRVLPTRCRLRFRGLDGSAGFLTLMKLANKAIYAKN